MSVTYKLQSFEGPLDLLLHLIDKAEVDIYNIPISEITDQYMEYLHAMEQLELDVTSEFLVMASTLLSMKSKLLLPKPPVINDEFDDYFYEDDIDPRAELVEKLIEYRKYKEIADHLREKEEVRNLLYTRDPEDLSPYVKNEPENPVLGLHASDLLAYFHKVLNRAVHRNQVARIRRDEISVKDRIKEMLTVLRHKGGKMLFSKLFDYEMTREEIVVTFLALLELMKMKKVSCYQHRLFEDIVIEARGEVDDSGFSADEVDY